MPMVSGTLIGLDNTCKSVYALQEFFGKGNSMNNPHTLKKVLRDYHDALERDLIWTEINSALVQQKKERLAQIEMYLQTLNHLEGSVELGTLTRAFPSYPRPLETMLQDKSCANLHSIILRPRIQDAYLRSEAAHPLFSVAHDSESRQIFGTQSPLQQALIKAYEGLMFTARNVTTQLIERVLAREFDRSDFEILRNNLHEEAKKLLGIAIDFNHDAQGNPLDKERIDADMMFDDQTSPEEYLNALLSYCAFELLNTHIESPFNSLLNAEQWSIATQFLLGITSLYGVAHNLMSSENNWGRLLDDNQGLSQSLADAMATAQQGQRSPEDALFNWVNAQSNQLGLKTPLSPEDMNHIKHDFALRYTQIKDSPHFDEFFLLDTQKKGAFVVHQGSICASFAEFACSELFDLPQELALSLKAPCKAFHDVNEHTIPHQNLWVQESIDLDLSLMDDNQLQNLYDQITTYKDPELKKQLLTAFQQERPDFKPQIDTKAFLQHVAYGEQSEAEALLKANPEQAQELLIAQNTPFTDYSGRTFKCTAYEYAYWAKDSHMQRMLERYMDDATKAIILERVLRIEELLGEGLFKVPRGLTYTQNGQEHRSAHFDLTPLKLALKTYIDAYDKSHQETDADWEALNILWVKAGLPQRDVPAHIAQEYCHPKRSFYEVSQDSSLLDASKPENLERSLKFCNYETSSDDAWFTTDSYSSDSGLGFSFAILRGVRAGCGASRRGGGGIAGYGSGCRVDLAAIEAIDKARTEDLKQSLANLATPSNPQPAVGLIF